VSWSGCALAAEGGASSEVQPAGTYTRRTSAR
jgi:hypothetical protein